MLAAVYASTGKNPAIVCILGTGSNSCYFNGISVEMKVPSVIIWLFFFATFSNISLK